MRSSVRVALIVVVLAALRAGGWLYSQSRKSDLPEGLAHANGRIEAERVDVALKFGGRIADVLVDVGRKSSRFH